MAVKVSIIIITKNQRGILEKSVPAILKQKVDFKFEVIVVDSGSTDGAIQFLKKQKVRLIQIKPEEFGYAKAFNIGARKAGGGILVRLSGDVIPLEDNWLEEIVTDLGRPKVGAVYGKYTISGRKGYAYPNFWPARRFGKKKEVFSIANPFFIFGRTKKATTLAGACFSTKREFWEKRNFNELTIEGEDADYAFYLHLLGYDVVYNPKAMVLHEHLISRNRPDLWSYLIFFRGVAKWQLVLWWEFLKLWYKRFFTQEFKDVVFVRN